MIRVWKNTATLDGYDEGIQFTTDKTIADLALLGSKPIDLSEFPNLKGIFRAGIGRDNVPVEAAKERNIQVCFPSQQTVNTIFEETANFTCQLIFRMIYRQVGTLDPWVKTPRTEMANQNLLVIGTGNIGFRVVTKMRSFMNVTTYDAIDNKKEELPALLSSADCITLHIPNLPENKDFLDQTQFDLMKDGTVLINTARAGIVNEAALEAAIKTKNMAAAFDVFWQEPYDGPLATYHPDPFYMTPHVASTCTGFLKGCQQDIMAFIKELS